MPLPAMADSVAAPAPADRPPARTPDRRTTLLLAAAFASGWLVALQQRVNAELGLVLQDALLAAVVSFLTGLALVAAVVAARPAGRRALARLRHVPAWQRLGGVGGASLVTAGAFATPVLGVALLTVGIVAGQIAGGLLVDRAGLAPGGRRLLTLPRVAGAVLCVVAVGLSALGPDAREADPLVLVLVVGAGLLIAVQQALNGRVQRTTGDAGVATLVNFLGGTVVLGVAYAIATAVRGLPASSWPPLEQWYLYLGGPTGVLFVALAAAVVRRLGVLRLGLAVISGQLAGALVLDLAAPATSTGVAGATLLGAALTLVAVALSGAGARRA